jgi:hypothetical protein
LNNTAENLDWQYDESIAVCDSFEYFCDNYVWIEDKERKAPLKLKLWPAQREVIGKLINDQLLMLLKTRQVGLTWLDAAAELWLAITNPLWLSIIISASEDHAVEFLDRVKFILDRLPSFLIPPIKSKTQQVIEFNHKGTTSTIKSMPTIKMGAESKTPNRMVIDEAHTIREIRQIFNSSYPGIEQAKGQVIIIANSIKMAAGWGFVRELYTNSMKGLNKFARIFLPWTAHPERPANFRALMIDKGMTPEDVAENYPETEEEAIAAASGSFFGSDLARHNESKRGVRGDLIHITKTELDFEENARGTLEVWRWPYYLLEDWNNNKWERRYAIGADVAEGLGGDYSVAYVYDRYLDEIGARYRSNRMDADKFGQYLQMLSKYYDKALIAVERNGAGITTIKRLQALSANQYVRLTPGKIGKAVTKEYGWLATGGVNGSKWELCGDLRTWFAKTKGSIYCPILIDEASVFIKYENGTLGAEEGKHDDCVIAAGLMLQASVFVGDKAKEIKPKYYGWRERLAADRAKGSVWAS